MPKTSFISYIEPEAHTFLTNLNIQITIQKVLGFSTYIRAGQN